jgi:hypothetical protein
MEFYIEKFLSNSVNTFEYCTKLNATKDTSHADLHVRARVTCDALNTHIHVHRSGNCFEQTF